MALNGFTNKNLNLAKRRKEEGMQPTRTEILEAWMTLVKVLDYYGPDYVDEYHKQVLPDVLSLLDKLQREER
jgi:hypothetical protein